VPEPERLPQRIVCLVPSLTEALFALGLGPRVVGVTDWCVHPADAVAPLPKLGGTKTPDVEAILRLRPGLVIANREENTRRDVERLRAGGLDVWVTSPRSVADAVALMRRIAELGERSDELARVVEPLEAALAAALARRPRHSTPFFCPIWRDPWMTVGPDTYAHDLLSLCGGRNVFADRRERRYPIVRAADIAEANPQVVLLPDEPYAFGPGDARDVAELAPAAAGRIHLIDGTLVSWYGPRIGQAIAELSGLLNVPA
jgi:ABC-type Fe3+-hydroxamate transport system substrate-binding protein